jgi:hypothetical protein
MSIHYFGPYNVHPKSKKYVPEIISCNLKLFTINNVESSVENIQHSSLHSYRVYNNINSVNIHLNLNLNNRKISIASETYNKYDLILTGNKFTFKSSLLKFKALEFNLEDDDSSEIENNLHELYKRIEVEFIINYNNLPKLERKLIKF